MHVSVAAETIFYIGSFPVNNSLLMTLLVSVFLIFIAIRTKSKISKIPSRLQAMMELIIDALLGMTEDVAGKELGRKIFPLLATFFLIIIMSNWSGLLPGVGSVGLKEEVEHAYIIEDPSIVYAEENSHEESAEPANKNEDTHEEITATTHEEGEVLEEAHGEESHEVFIPLFRGPTADLNVTLALAIISVVMIQYYGLKKLGPKYLKKFFNFKGPIDAFIGILELISEFSRIISFAFRLYGNIFAGEVLLVVISTLVPFIAPLPFIGLELFVGFIQALVFMMLSLVFISMATHEH